MKNFGPFLLSLGLLPACVTPYNPNVRGPSTGYLVVEGNLNKGQATTITLSRTTPVSDTVTQLFETGATVQVEGSDGSLVPLPETSPGQYSVDSLPLNPADTYRLDINTRDGDQFASDFVKVITTPPIDSINYAWLGDGVHLYVNTHNNSGNTRYYQYTYVETWQYRSMEQSFYIWDTSTQLVIPRPPAQQVYNCWKTLPSTSVVLNSTANLDSDIAHFQLFVIQNGDQRLSVLYSILVDEYGISDSDYNYLQEMATSTEGLGTIFEPVPTQLTGNIHSIKNPSEQVVGYVNASAKAEVRYFISEPQGWPYDPICSACSGGMVVDSDDYVDELYYYEGILPRPPPLLPPAGCLYDPVVYSGDLVMGIEVAGYTVWPTSCVDCTLQGGVNVKPSFWP